mmetsp:Transcript_6203/g.17985  ORF Transcript_6203/g.17985 Transcript_6203/m.17985 type:complete len:201 (+) Transcript_6203:237-839(+)
MRPSSLVRNEPTSAHEPPPPLDDSTRRLSSIRMPAAGQPRAVSRTWQVRKPVGFGRTSSLSRIHAILCTCATASASSAAAELVTRRSKAAKMVALLALRTARMKGNPKRAVYASLSFVKRASSSAEREERPAWHCSAVLSLVSSPASAALPARSGCERRRASRSASVAPSTASRSAEASAASEAKGAAACARSATQGDFS